MIYIDPGQRRADTMSIVAEHCAWRNVNTGEFKLVGKACGYLERVLTNLAEFYEAGLIYCRRGTGEWQELAWTTAGEHLWKQWKQGPPRRVVEMPAPLERPAMELPKHAAAMLLDSGWTVSAVWKTEPLEYLVVSISRADGEKAMPIDRVLVMDARGGVVLDLPGAEAAMMVPMLLAASL